MFEETYIEKLVLAETESFRALLGQIHSHEAEPSGRPKTGLTSLNTPGTTGKDRTYKPSARGGNNPSQPQATKHHYDLRPPHERRQVQHGNPQTLTRPVKKTSGHSSGEAGKNEGDPKKVEEK